jgi:ribonucleoside-diphosphate reductase alpha chain
MTSGIPYDSDEGRAICGALTAIMTGVAYATSAEMAGELGAFPGYAKNAEHMLRVMRNHRRAAYGEPTATKSSRSIPVPLDPRRQLPGQRLVEARPQGLGSAPRARRGSTATATRRPP